MKSQALRSSRLTVNQARKKKNSSNKLSQSPTLTSTYSQKSLWTHSYKNQPFPKQLRKKLWGKKFQFDFSSEDEEEQIAAVLQQEEEGHEKKVKRLPHFKIISDRGEFLSKRSRIRSEVQFRYREKCKSVESMKQLPKVQEEKREEDDLKKLQRSKLSYFKDKNEFNQRKRKSSDSHTSQINSKVQSLENVYMSTSRRDLPQEIEESQAQQTKSVKLQGSMQKNLLQNRITAEIQKLIVDQLDSRRRKDETISQEISEIIEEKLEEDDENAKVARLRQSLEKFQTQSEYLKKLRDQVAVRKSGKEDEIDESQSQESQSNNKVKNSQKHHQVPLQRQKLAEYEDIRECSSSGKEDDYLKVSKLAVIKEEPKQENKQSSTNCVDTSKL